MSNLGERVQRLRKELNFSQLGLANEIGVSKAQMNRYENQGVQPPADVLNKMANTLNTSMDYLVNGDIDEKATEHLKNTLLLQKFKELEQLPKDELEVILKMVSAYIRDFNARQAYSN